VIDVAPVIALAALVVAFAAFARAAPPVEPPARPVNHGRPRLSGRIPARNGVGAASPRVVPGGCTILVGATASCWLAINEPAKKDGSSMLIGGGLPPVPINVGLPGTVHELHVLQGKDPATLFWTALEA
jgi:hypothetical protein